MLWPAPQLTQKQDCPKAKQMTWQARRALERGETEAALSLSHAALGLYDRTTNTDGRHHAATLVGDTLMAVGQAAQAVDYYRRALEIDLSVAQAGGWVKLAEAYQASGQLNAAYRAYADAQRLYARLGQTALTIKALYCMAYVRYEQERWAEAAALYRQTLARLGEPPTDRGMYSRSLLELGNSLAQQGQLTEARQCFAQSAASAGALGDMQLLASALHGLGVTYAHAGQPEQAMPLYLSSLDLHTAQGDALAEACTLYELGMNWARLGQTEQATQHLTEAIALYEALDAEETTWARAGLHSVLASTVT